MTSAAVMICTLRINMWKGYVSQPGYKLKQVVFLWMLPAHMQLTIKLYFTTYFQK